MIRLKQMCDALLHFLVFLGPVDFAFFLASNPDSFQTAPLLSLLFLLLISVSTPLVFVSFFYSTHIHSHSLYMHQPLRSLFLNQFDLLGDGFLFETLLSLLYLISHSHHLGTVKGWSVLEEWSPLSCLILLSYSLLNYCLRVKIQDENQLTLSFLNRIKRYRLLGELGVSFVWMMWTV